jgi:hypothetical protein
MKVFDWFIGLVLMSGRLRPAGQVAQMLSKVVRQNPIPPIASDYRFMRLRATHRGASPCTLSRHPNCLGSMPMTTLRSTLIGCWLFCSSVGALAQSSNQSSRLFEQCFQAGRLGNAICDRQADPGERLDCLETVRAEQFECLRRILPEETATTSKAPEPSARDASDSPQSAPIKPSTAATPEASRSPDTEPAASDGTVPSSQSAAIGSSAGRGEPTEAAQPAPAIKRVETDQSTESLAAPLQSAEAAKPVVKPPQTETSTSLDIAEPTQAASSVDSTMPTVGSASPAQPVELLQRASPAAPDEPVITEKAELPNDNVIAKTKETNWVVSETTSPVDYSPLISATIRPRQKVNSGLSGLTISCRAKRIELSLRLMEDVDVPRFGEIQIVSQINDQHPIKQRWIWDEEGIILNYVQDPVVFLQSVPDGARLRLGIGDSKGARHMAVYQLFGLDAVRKKIGRICAWPTSVQASSEKR